MVQEERVSQDLPCDESDGTLVTGHTPMLGCVVGIIAVGDSFKCWELCLDGLDKIAVRHEFLHLPLVSIEGHVLQGKSKGRYDVSREKN